MMTNAFLHSSYSVSLARAKRESMKSPILQSDNPIEERTDRSRRVLPKSIPQNFDDAALHDKVWKYKEKKKGNVIHL